MWVRRAAAAAAEDKAPLDSRSRMKALVAARDADAEGGLFEAGLEEARFRLRSILLRIVESATASPEAVIILRERGGFAEKGRYGCDVM